MQTNLKTKLNNWSMNIKNEKLTQKHLIIKRLKMLKLKKNRKSNYYNSKKIKRSKSKINCDSKMKLS